MTVERAPGNHPLILDTRELKIIKVEASADGKGYTETKFTLAQARRPL